MNLQSFARSRLQSVYNRTVRKFLPTKISVHNGVAVKGAVRLFDIQDCFPEYEAALISAIRNRVNNSDKVQVVGGGLGVSTVVAARGSGQDGAIVTYEGSRSQYNLIKNTVNLNLVSRQVNIHHSVVGSFSEYSSDSYGNIGDAEIIGPQKLPDCDVLVLDCEGAELEILKDMTIRPRAIIVESHGMYDSPSSEVENELKKRSYSVESKEIAEKRFEKVHRKEDVFVISAIQKE